ncbi:hypothetical protein DQ226_01260 [Dietzia maris]|uniref:Uncharacterized protein n=1 Tax=Dietzia maris TaxID=37915 RepID=A0A365PDS5_9ACTN|nr:hypothetical protein DQ226_01260 [Dietzia maris]
MLVYVALFMTIVPPEVLRRQRAAVTAWIDEVLEASQRDRAIRLGDSFAERDVISGVEIFREPMRGVWVWRKPSIMPHLYLGWALADPRTAETFDESDAVFLRRTPKSLRRRSRLEHQGQLSPDPESVAAMFFDDDDFTGGHVDPNGCSCRHPFSRVPARRTGLDTLQGFRSLARLCP